MGLSKRFNLLLAIELALVLRRAYYLVQSSGAAELEQFLKVVPSKNVPALEILHHVRFLAAIAPVDITCLTRSAVLTYALRKAGHDASVVIGVAWQPFESHAWVEVDGKAFSEPSRILLHYQRMASIPEVPQ